MSIDRASLGMDCKALPCLHAEVVAMCFLAVNETSGELNFINKKKNILCKKTNTNKQCTKRLVG